MRFSSPSFAIPPSLPPRPRGPSFTLRLVSPSAFYLSHSFPLLLPRLLPDSRPFPPSLHGPQPPATLGVWREGWKGENRRRAPAARAKEPPNKIGRNHLFNSRPIEEPAIGESSASARSTALPVPFALRSSFKEKTGSTGVGSG